jgi:hypothetical protein
MNLARFDTRKLSESGVEFELKDPATDEYLGVFLTILGPDSKAARGLMKKLEEKQREKNRYRRKVEDTDDDTAELFAELVTGWRNMVYNPEDPDDTTELPFTKANLVMVLRDLNFVANQIASAFGDRRLFMPA